MDKRSRHITARREDLKLVADLTRKNQSLIDLLKLEHYRKAAAFARSRARAGHSESCTITWMTDNFHTTRAEAAEWIAIGESIHKESDHAGAVTCTCDRRAENAPLSLQAPSGRSTTADERLSPLLPRDGVTWWQGPHESHVVRVGRLIQRLLGFRSRLPALTQSREEQLSRHHHL